MHWWVEADWPVWRIVLDMQLSLAEVDREWSLDDVLDANEVLDVAADVQASRKDSPTPSNSLAGKTGRGPRPATAGHVRPPKPARR